MSVILEAARRVLGVRVIFRDYLHLAELTDDLRWRIGPACTAVKSDPERLAACRAFCARRTVREVSLVAEGRCQTCPFGHTETIVPVIIQGRAVGQVIAGPFWTGTGQPPRQGLTVIDEQRLADVHLMLQGLALRCAHTLEAGGSGGDERRHRITDLLERRHHLDLSLADLARQLGLSSSRCGHLVQELYGRSFPALLREVRLNHAVRLLHGSEDSITTIAARTGFRDASYFARVFRAAYGCGPSEFRARPTYGGV
jgi:AraC-like DNA-binding protein